MKDYQSVRDIAARTGLSEDTVKRMIRDDNVPHCRTGKNQLRGKILVRWSDWETYMSRRIGEIQQDPDVMGILEEMFTSGPRTH